MTTFRVANADQLLAALGRARGGDTVIASSGDYGNVNITNRHYASNVTIQASSPNDPAHFDGLFISNSRNLTISGIDLGRAIESHETAEWTQLNWVRNSANIRFTGVDIHGSFDNDPSNDGMGLVVTGTNGFRIDNSHFSELYRGIFVQRSANTQISSNSFETIRSDGVMGAALNTANIADNSFTDFRPITGDHADAIQFWNTSQTTGSRNVMIRGNVIAPGQYGDVEVGNVQGIWIADPLSYGYYNFQITNNLIYTHGVWNGIGVSGGRSFVISNNTLLSQEDDNKNVWIRAENMVGMTMRNNVAEDIILTNVRSLTQSGNIDLSNTPGLRDLIPDADTPDTLRDLLIPNIGYQAAIGSKSAAARTLDVDATGFYEWQPSTAQVFGALEYFTALP